MNMKPIIFVLVTPIFIYALNASATDDPVAGTGNELIKFCNQKAATDNDESWSICIGYVGGVRNGYEFLANMLQYLLEKQKTSKTPNIDSNTLNIEVKIFNGYFCIPDNVTRNQQSLVVSKYLTDHPESLNEPSADLIIEAFAAAWPCKK